MLRSTQWQNGLAEVTVLRMAWNLNLWILLLMQDANLENDMSDVEIEVEVRARTDKAFLVFDGKIECWIPKSQISDYSGEEDSPESIFIPEYIAYEKGLI